MKLWIGLAAAAFGIALGGCAPGGGGDGEDVGAAREALEVCPAKKTLSGLDVSHYDGDVDWTKVAASGRAFGIAKATEGETFADPKFAANWAGMKKAGIARGAYHFFRANDDAVKQADWFLEAMGDLEPGDLPPSLDLEDADGVPAAEVTEKTFAWLDRVAAKTKTKPIVYTSTRFVNESMGGDPKGFEDHATLWVANWDVTCPNVPTPFTGFSFWQTGSGEVPGDDGGPADVDVFNGDAKALAAFVVQPPKPEGGGGSTAGAGGRGGGGAAATSATGGGDPVPHQIAATSDTDSGCALAPRASSSPPPLLPISLALALAALARRRAR